MSKLTNRVRAELEMDVEEAKIQKEYPDAHILRIDGAEFMTVIHLPGGRFRRKDGEANRIHRTVIKQTRRKE